MIYRGYAIFRRYKGRIVDVPEEFPDYHGNISCVGDRIFIFLNENDSQNQKIKTVVHELMFK